jgi:hypothetical protein
MDREELRRGIFGDAECVEAKRAEKMVRRSAQEKILPRIVFSVFQVTIGVYETSFFSFNSSLIYAVQL